MRATSGASDAAFMKRAIGLSLILVLVSNSTAFLIYVAGADRRLLYLPSALVLLAAALWWARHSARVSWPEMGLGHAHWKQGAFIGAAMGLGASLLLIILLAIPFPLRQPVRYLEIQNLDAVGLLWRLGVELTFATVLTEEFLFRGILQALFRRALRTRQALIATGVVFALWHLVINASSVQQNPLTLPFMPPLAAQAIGYIGSLVAVGIGGLFLGILRERTGHLAGSLALHWIPIAALTIVIYLQR